VDLVIHKVVIPAAGLGTRLFPATKEQPKEMLPIFSSAGNGNLRVMPLLQMVYEQLYDSDFREFCFVVGRGKRSIEDHFTPDSTSVTMLENIGKDDQAKSLNEFYRKLETSTILWVNQPKPRGFGNAVLMAKPVVQNDCFLVHAGDNCIISPSMDHIKVLQSAYEKLNAAAAFIVLEIENPKQYGIIEGEEIQPGIYKVKAAIEKPEKPPTNLAIVAIYFFQPIIFKALEEIQPGKGGEIQLTDAIQKLIDWELNVYGVKLGKDYKRIDIGNPEDYSSALSLSYQRFSKKSTNQNSAT
jgi:UTP--glucose-1-phosphate uridylyltransferase